MAIHYYLYMIVKRTGGKHLLDHIMDVGSLVSVVEVCTKGKSEASIEATLVGSLVEGSMSISFNNKKKITSPTDTLNLLLKQVANELPL